MTIRPDLLVRNARIYTLDPAQPWADALVVHGGRLSFVGREADLPLPWRTATKTLDAAGRTILPGFIDSHLHLLWYGSQLLRQADLVGVNDIDALLDRLSRQAARSVGWIQGHGFDQDKLRENRFPTRDDLDRVSRDRPIVISRICGHATVVNSAALALLDRGELSAGDVKSGLFTETSSNAFYRRIPPLSEAEQDQAALLAANVAVTAGITSCQTLLDSPDQMAAWSRLRACSTLPMRIVGSPPYAAVETLHAHGIRTGFGDERVRFGGAKIFSDGSLGARTALLSDPYADDATTRGVRIHAAERLKTMCRDAQAKGFQLTVHAIGDQAVRETIDALEFALDGAPNRFRHRIEHVSVCPPDCLERMAALGLVAAVQPQFIKSDTWTATRLGPRRARWAYPFASLLRAGVTLALGSDCPVEKLDAFACLAAATQRDGINADQALTIEQAIHAYCLGSAFAGHSESFVGSLEVGKCADFVVLSEPIVDQPQRLADCLAEQTFVGGVEQIG